MSPNDPPCPVCRNPVSPSRGRGRPPRYCDPRCRRRAEDEIAALRRRIPRLERKVLAEKGMLGLSAGFYAEVRDRTGLSTTERLRASEAALRASRARLLALTGAPEASGARAEDVASPDPTDAGSVHGLAIASRSR